MAPSWNPFYGRGRNLRLLIIMLVIILLFWHLRDPDSASIFHRRYEAPIRNRNVDSRKIAPQEYIVHLRQGHSMSHHMAAIGRDLKAHLRNQYNVGTNELTYSVIGVDDALLKAIRSDPMVKFVEHDLRESEPRKPKGKAKKVVEEKAEAKTEVKAEAKPVEKPVEKEEPKPAAKADAEEEVKEQPA